MSLITHTTTRAAEINRVIATLELRNTPQTKAKIVELKERRDRLLEKLQHYTTKIRAVTQKPIDSDIDSHSILESGTALNHARMFPGMVKPPKEWEGAIDHVKLRIDQIDNEIYHCRNAKLVIEEYLKSETLTHVELTDYIFQKSNHSGRIIALNNEKAQLLLENGIKPLSYSHESFSEAIRKISDAGICVSSMYPKDFMIMEVAKTKPRLEGKLYPHQVGFEYDFTPHPQLPPAEKENTSMKTASTFTHNVIKAISAEKLKAVAGLKDEQDDLSSMLPKNLTGDGELAEALRESFAEDRKLKVKQAVESIRTVITYAEEAIKGNISQIRDIRRAERAYLDEVKAINLAMAYGQETSNYLPLAWLVTHDEEFKGHEVPADWKPKVEETPDSNIA